VPAADFSADELLYLPRNMRAHRLYGLSPVEQIALTVNIAIRRDIATLDYYQMGSVPDAFATLPKEWTPDQIRAFQDYFDALMSGNLARKRMTKFMPADFKLIETRQPPLKDLYDEWLARIICYAFSVPASAFVSQVNRATSETLRLQATQEGLIPLKAWVKSALDYVIQVCMNEPALEFVWVGDDAIDPLQQAQTLQILVGAGIKTREEARAELGLGTASGAPGREPVALGKFNLYHDEQGRFTTADDAVEPGSGGHGRPRPKRVEVASNDSAMSDAGGDSNSQAIAAAQAGEVAQIEPIEPPAAGPPETPPPGQDTEAAPKGSASSPTRPDDAGSGGAESSPGDSDSTDQDDDVEFESTSDPRFASGGLLTRHFLDHGNDFGAETESEYENQAGSFLTDQDNSDILEFMRRIGDTVRFNPLTDEFGVISSDGKILTYYRPDPQIHGRPTNLDYYYDQKESDQ
jgi:Phage portal protein